MSTVWGELRYLLYAFPFVLFFALWSQWSFQSKIRKIWSIALMIFFNINATFVISLLSGLILANVMSNYGQPGDPILFSDILAIIFFIVISYTVSFFSLLTVGITQGRKRNKERILSYSFT
jgi:hypothetical protein